MVAVVQVVRDRAAGLGTGGEGRLVAEQSNSRMEWKLSEAALSSADPVRPINWRTPAFVQAWANTCPVYSPP